MQNLHIRSRRLDRDSLVQNLIEGISDRYFEGKIVIATESPSSLVGIIRNTWDEMSASEKSLGSPPHVVDYLRKITFVSKEVPGNSEILCATIDDLIRTPPSCRTIFITHDINSSELSSITSMMPAGGLAVLYAVN